MNQVPLIAHVVYKLDVGGLENGLVNIINNIPDDRYRHVIISLTGHTSFSERIEKDVELVDLNKKPGKDIHLYYRLFNAFREIKPDIVHTRNLATIEAHIPAFLAGVPFRVHGEHGRDIHDIDNSSRKYRVIRKVIKPFIHHFIGLSTDLSDYLSNCIGVKQRCLSTICNGVDSCKFTPDRRDCTIREINKDGVVFGSVGRLEVVKGHVDLIDAFHLLVENNQGIKDRLKLILVGEGSERINIERKIKDYSIDDNVILLGSRDDVADILPCLDVFVLPSLAEGISNTVLEAMACGLPVVCTNVGGNSELVSDGKSGYLVPRSDPTSLSTAMQHYLHDDSLVKTHGNYARGVIEKTFSIQSMVASYLDVYDRHYDRTSINSPGNKSVSSQTKF